jgi:phosphatidylcholine synthase
LLALMAAVDRRWATMFAWLGLAAIVDGIDGTFARRLRVAERVPRWSGDVLDLVVDIITYVFVPAYALATSGLLPASLSVPLAIVIVMTSVLYFADTRMKSADNFFMGFPAVWNVVAFYLFLISPHPFIAAAVVVALAVLTFVPLPFVHPFRVRQWQAVTLAVTALWTVLGGVALLYDLAPPAWVTYGLCLSGFYLLALGFFRRDDLEKSTL